MPKKFFIIFLILFVLAGVALVFYNFVLKSDEPPADQPDTPDKPLSLAITPIGLESAFALTISEDKQSIKYYLTNNGHVIQSDFDGANQKIISSTDLIGLTQIIWSPDKIKVVGVYGQDETARKNTYNYETKKATSLNDGIKSIAWSPSSEKVAYQYKSPDNSQNTISIANQDATNWRNVFTTRLPNLIVSWPTPENIYISEPPSGLAPSSFFKINAASGDTAKIFSNIYGFSVLWSPDGQKFIYSQTDSQGKNLKLFVAQADGSQPGELPIVTLPEKCTWSHDSQTIFCAGPQKISPNATWPDDYFARQLIIHDDFYLIDAVGQTKTKIAASGNDQSFDAQNLILSPAEDYLFFINQKNKLVYNIKLELK